MVIMWDVDGVLANFTKGYHGLANEMFASELVGEISAEAPPSWDWLEDTLGSERVGKIWNRIKQDRYFWQDLEPLVSEGEIRRISDLVDEADQYFVTSRVGQKIGYQTRAWLRHHFYIDSPAVIVSDRKADSANALKANYTIDDKAGNVLAVYYNSPKERRVYVLDTPYNQFDPKTVGSRVRRVSTVSQFLDDIEANR